MQKVFKRENRKNGMSLQNIFLDHHDILIQKEIGESSWFGFSLIIRPGSKVRRHELIYKLNKLGFEVRPIVAGNFAKNEVIKYFNYEIYGELKNANHIDKYGLFIGNQHYSMLDAFEELKNI